MRLLVTRPEPDAAALRAHLVAQGHEVLIEPLITIRFDNADPIELDGVQALIATSRNGLRALAASPAFDDALMLPLFAVGPGTAATARALGFRQVVKGPGTGRQLVSFIVERADVNGGPLLHLAGDTLAFDFASELARLGFHVLRPVVYAAEPATRLSGSTAARLSSNRIDGVLLLSPRTAEIYVRLVAAHGLADAVRGLTHYCISAVAAAQLEQLAPAKVEVAAEPNLQEVLALTARAAPQSA
ncbi:MAG: uroporphyrinogen-III synthase [Hyphomicrobiaceae bacterium]|nr:uroporphyrinogen-III synthase [Hyphomicrobiaceae bacterium]